MLFLYRKYRIRPTPVFPGGVLYRPEVLVRIIGPSGDVFLRGLVDTGADSTILPRSIATSLGVAFCDGDTSRAAGFTGDQLDVVYAEVEFEVIQRGEQHRWRTLVGFVDYPRPELEQTLLGRVGFLDQFMATFDPDHNQVELVLL
jgi:predicted aspartyl protease